MDQWRRAETEVCVRLLISKIILIEGWVEPFWVKPKNKSCGKMVAVCRERFQYSSWGILGMGTEYNDKHL